MTDYVKVETSSARVLSDGEQRIAGWTLLSPEGRNVKLSPKLEEKALILVRRSSGFTGRLTTVADQICHIRCFIQLST